MKTYQDLLKTPENLNNQAEFVRSVITEHKSSSLYRTAETAKQYDAGQNTTIMTYQKYFTDLVGRQNVDTLSPIHRSASNFFHVFVSRLSQYLLGNGVMWKGGKGDKLGEDFDTQLQQAGKNALIGGVSFGFFNFDHVEIFPVTEFAPLYDEENGALMAGVRFWQIDSKKPMRATLYTLDGITDYLWLDGSQYTPDDHWTSIDSNAFYQPRRAYTRRVVSSPADGIAVYDGRNYPTFPIVPLWANDHHQSELVAMREKIDAYDFILNGFEDDLDNAQLYWIIKGAGGMDDLDLMQFLDRLKTVKAAAPADGQDVVPVEVNIPYEARERLLDRLEKQLYKDSMIMNPADIASGAATATQIKAAYEPQNNRADELEYQVIRFIQGLLAVAGVEDEPSFTRSIIINTQEEITSVTAAATYLSDEYVTRKILTLLGDGDMADEVLKQRDAEDYNRLATAEE